MKMYSKKYDKILLATPFFLTHLTVFAAFWTGVRWFDLVVCAALYVVRMFAVTGGYHRYFAHRTYKTSRFFQFIIALTAQSSAQRGILWWASKHREHHKYSDTPKDVHSPRQKGFWYAHLGWIFVRSNQITNLDAIRDYAKYPELVWLDKHRYYPAILLGVAVWLLMGWSGLVVGFFWSTVILYHTTFSINSLAHVVGTQRYDTGDDSRNCWWLAIFTMGEGWHNNHHHYQSSVQQGFFPWEVDFTYYGLKFLSFFSLIWDLRSPPKDAIQGKGKLLNPIKEKIDPPPEKSLSYSGEVKT